MDKSIYIPLDIEKVLELRVTFENTTSTLYAHLSKKYREVVGGEKQYAFVSWIPEHGMARLGEIDPVTGEFRLFEPKDEIATYDRAPNGVVNRMVVAVSQINRLRTIDEILAIPGVSIYQEFRPE